MITWLIWTIWTSLSAVRERLLNLITHSLTWIFKVKFWKCCIRNGRADWHRTKGMWVDRMLDSHCDLNFDLTHDLDLGSSRSVFEKAVSQEWEGQSTNTGKSIRFVNRNLIANQPINQYQKFELLISVIHFWYSNMGKSIALPISEVEFPILMNYVKNIWIFFRYW